MTLLRFLYVFYMLSCFTHPLQAHPVSNLELVPWHSPSGLWGYCDSNGAVKIAPRFTHAAPFVNGYAVIATDSQYDQYGIIDAQGGEVFPMQYRYIRLAAGPGYTIAITARRYNAWWKLGSWRFWPGFSTTSGSSRDKRIFDTRVRMLQWELIHLESGSIFFTKSKKDDGGRGYGVHDMELHDDYFLFQNYTYKVSKRL